MKISFQKIASAFLLVLFWLTCSCQLVGAVSVQSYEGLVNDFAQVLSEEVESSLETRLLEEANKDNGVELAVVTVSSLAGEEIESVALAYFDTWKIGKAKQDNGVLLLIAVTDRELRIQTGYGVEPVLPDGVAGRIIREDIVPHLKNEQYDQAVLVGVDRILALIANPEIANESNPSSRGSLWMVLIILLGFFGFVGLIIWLTLKYSPSLSTLPNTSRSSWSKPSSFSSSSRSSSSSSFSFGGGRSGGGGASGKW